ncbi:MAG: peptidylprolyl isomerase [Usitatibacter sp.]
MRHIPILAAAVCAAFTFAAQAESLPPEAPLITDGTTVVDAGDFEGNLLRIPENRRSEVRTSYDRVASIVDNIFIARSLAQRARELGLDKDPIVQRRLRQVQDGVLADLYVQKLEKEALNVDLEQRVRELYRADQAKFMSSEQVYVQHILVNLNGRTRETALERAKKVAAEAKGGEDFLALAAKYSDDPEVKRNGGDLGYNAPTSFVPSVVKAIAGMSKKGEISDPLESDFGFHIVKFIERKKPEPIKFESVRKKMIEAEKERLQKARTESLVLEVRSAPSVVVYRENVEGLVLKVDPEMLRRAMEAVPPAK